MRREAAGEGQRALRVVQAGHEDDAAALPHPLGARVGADAAGVFDALTRVQTYHPAAAISPPAICTQRAGVDDAASAGRDQAARTLGVVRRHEPRVDELAAVTGVQGDHTIHEARAIRLHQARGVDDAVDHALERTRTDQHLAAIGNQPAAVIHQSAGRARRNLHRTSHLEGQELVAHHIHDEGLRPAQHHAAQIRLDEALVTHLLTGEYCVAPVGRGDSAEVDDCRPGGHGIGEAIPAGQKVAIGQGARGAKEPCTVNLPARANKDAVGVEQPHLAVGAECALQERGLGAGHAIERDG